MKIAAIELIDFRSHKVTRLDELPAVTWIVGQNRSGKSTVIDAVAYALRGVCRGTDGGGRGAEALIRSGADAFTVSLTTDRGVLSRRGPGGGPKSDAQRNVDRLLDSRLVDPLLLIDPLAFFRAPATEQKSALQAALVTKLDPAQVRALIGAAFARLEPLRLDWTEAGSLDAAEHYCRSRRPVLKGIIEGAAAPDLSGFSPEMRALSAAEAGAQVLIAEERLAGLREQRKRGGADLSGLEEAANEATKAVGQWRARLDAVNIANIRPQLAQEIRDAESALTSAYQERDDLQDTVTAALQLEQELAEAKAAGAPKCPACGRPLEEADVTKRLSSLLQQINAAREAPAKLAKVLEDIDTLEGNVAAMKLAHEGDVEAQVQHAAATESLRLAQEAAASAAHRLAAARATALPPEALAALDERIRRGEGIAAQGRAYAQVRLAAERAGATIRSQEAELADIEALCAALGPHGIRQKLAGDGSAIFSKDVVAVGAALGLSVSLEMEPFRVTVDGHPVAALSYSEQICVGLAMQAALARLSRLDFLCVDGAEVFDGAWRGAVMKLLSEGLAAQAIVCATLRGPDADFVPFKIAGWATWLAQKNGGISEARRLA